MGKKKQTQTTNETSKIVQTATNPEWVTAPVQDLAGRIGNLKNLDPASMVSPLAQREKDAFARADNLGIDNDWFASQLSSPTPTVGFDKVSAQNVQAASLLDNLSSYMSPYTKDVVDAALADFDFGAGQTRAQQDLDLAGATAFGGSGVALTKSMTEDALNRGRASTSANLRDQAFQVGANLSNQDAARRQAAAEASARMAQEAALANSQLGFQASSKNADLGLQDRAMKFDMQTGRDANERLNIATLAGAGATERGIDQQIRNAPIAMLQTESGLLNSLPLQLFHGQTQEGTKTGTTTSTQSGGMLESLGTLAMGLGALGFAPFTGGASLLGLGAGLGGAASSGLMAAAGAARMAG